MAKLLRILSRPAIVLLLLGLAPAVVGAQGVMPLPIVAVSEPFVSEGDIKVYTVDLGTLPERGALRVQVTPDAAHPDLETEITIGNWALDFTGPGFFCIYSSTYTDSATSVGVNVLEAVNEIIQCDPRTATFPFNWSGSTVDVQIRVTDFGQAGAGANADILIRGVTKVPTRDLFEAVETDLSLQTAYFEASKDTVLYQRNSSFSNGLGQYLWGGMDYTLIGPPFNLVLRQRLNSLLAFPLLSSSSPIPFNADIVDASLSLYAWEVLNGGGSFTLFETAADPSGATWSEGNADADFPEFAGAQATNFAATASHRQRSPSTSLYPWDNSGGDVAGLQLAVETVTTTGFTTFSSSALANAVQGMIDRGNASDGFLLRGPYSLFGTQDIGVRFASRNYTSRFYTPSLRVDYVPSNPYTDGSFNPGVVSFISEGENFRWIYDTDEDDVLLTSIGGVCDATEPDFVNNLPYTYEFTGAPGYTGLDCCTWQVESQQTGTVGAGQALFFHNLDPLNPANLPPDTDGDGIFDPCDNCPTVPNGPALGSCVGASGVAGTCLSRQDCMAGFSCQFAQQDSDFDFAGDVCSVPEPGFGVGLVAASALLLAFASRRRRRVLRVGCPFVKHFTVSMGFAR